MIETAVFDTGPWMHTQFVQPKALRIIKKSVAPPAVFHELRTHHTSVTSLHEIPLNGKHKDLAKIIAERHALDLGESEAIALATQEKIRLIFSDDLDARSAATTLGFHVHGTLALITRAYREKTITQQEAERAIILLQKESRLFLTSDLVNWALREIRAYKR